MNRYFLIDFDNVASGGLDGCKNLTDEDYIYLFYTESSKQISLDLSEDIANRTAEIVAIHCGNDNSLISIHNDLQGEIENGGQIYQLIKPVMNKYGKVPQKNINMTDKQILNNAVMNILYRLGYSNEDVGVAASVTVKNFGTEKAKFHTYLNLISRFGKAKGLEIYNSIRGVI